MVFGSGTQDQAQGTEIVRDQLLVEQTHPDVHQVTAAAIIYILYTRNAPIAARL